MNVKLHHTTKQLLKLYRKEPNHRLARRIHGVYLAGEDLRTILGSTEADAATLNEANDCSTSSGNAKKSSSARLIPQVTLPMKLQNIRILRKVTFFRS